MLLPPIITAQALGIDTTTEAWAHVRRELGALLIGEPEDAIERAARTRAVERWPLAHRRPCMACDGHAGFAHALEPDGGGTDGCPPAATRHVLAGCLVLELCSMGGFRYGTPPPATPRDLERLPEHARIVRSSPLDRAQYDPDYPDAPHYAMAHRIMEFALGMSTTRDPEGPSNPAVATAEEAGAMIDAAIALLCDPRPVAEVACDLAATVLRSTSSSREPDRLRSAIARARRVLRVVAPRE